MKKLLKLSDNQYDTLFSFCGALMLVSGSSLEQLDDLFINNFNKISAYLYNKGWSFQKTQTLFSQSEILRVSDIFNKLEKLASNSEQRKIDENDLDILLELRNLAYNNAKLKDFFFEAGAFLQTKELQRSRSGKSAEVYQEERFNVKRALGLIGLARSPFDKSRLTCYARASMKERIVRLQDYVTVDIILSGTPIESSGRNALNSDEEFDIDSQKKILVRVSGENNFKVVDESNEKEMDMPVSGKERAYFHLKPTGIGNGKILISFQQKTDFLPLYQLSLEPKIVESEDDIDRLEAEIKNSAYCSDGLFQDRSDYVQPQFCLRIDEERLSNGSVIYSYTLQSYSLEFKVSGKSEVIDNRETYISGIYQEIENIWEDKDGDTDEIESSLKIFGGTLFDKLFPLKIKLALWNYREQITEIFVISEEPFIPWELIYLKQTSEIGEDLPLDEYKGCFLGEKGLTRWLPNNGVPTPPNKITIHMGQVCHLIPQYSKKGTFEVLPFAPLEADILESIFNSQPIEARQSVFRKKMQSCDFDLLHYSGHGECMHTDVDNAKLFLSSDDKEVVTTNLVEQSLRTSSSDRKRRPVVVLNACGVGRSGYSLSGMGGFAKAFLSKGAGIFIGTLWNIHDKPAVAFIETFYESLGGDLKNNSQALPMTLADAAVAARKAARASKDATWLAYTVYGYPSATIEIEREIP